MNFVQSQKNNYVLTEDKIPKRLVHSLTEFEPNRIETYWKIQFKAF